MKKFGKLKLKAFHVMDGSEMKHVLGGYTGSNICMSEDTYGYVICTKYPEHAAEEGTAWWCCNCQKALDVCGSFLYPGSYPPI